jgi:hypothetical protein
MVCAFDLLRRCQWKDADYVLGQGILISSVALGSDVRPVVGASHPVLLGNWVSTYMAQEALSQDVSYDACVKLGVDHMGRSEFSDAIAHLREQLNAVTYKRQLEARGETVHVQKNTVYGFSEATRAKWFMDYEPKARPPNHQEPLGVQPSPTPDPGGWFRFVRQAQRALVQEVVQWVRKAVRCLTGKVLPRTQEKRMWSLPQAVRVTWRGA